MKNKLRKELEAKLKSQIKNVLEESKSVFSKKIITSMDKLIKKIAQKTIKVREKISKQEIKKETQLKKVSV